MGIIVTDNDSQAVSLGKQGINNYSSGGSSIVYDEDAERFFYHWATTVDDDIKQIYNALIMGCKSDVSLRGTTSNWTELEGLWIFMGPTRQISYLNIRRPYLTPASDIVQPTFIPLQYIVSDGTQYLNLNYNASTNATVSSQNDMSFGVWCETNTGISAVPIGAFNASNQGISINPRTATDIMQGACNSTNANIGSAGTTTDASGFKMIRRVNSTQIRTNKGGVAVASELVTTSSSVAPVNLSLYALARNSNGTANLFDTRAYSIMWVGSGNLDPVALKIRLEAFKA